MTRLGILLSGRGSNFVAIAGNIAGGQLAAQIGSPSSSAIARTRAALVSQPAPIRPRLANVGLEGRPRFSRAN